MNHAVFLDRDNTLIANEGDLGDPDEVRLLPGVSSGVNALHQAGYALIVITNQGGVARGRYTEEDVDAVNCRIADLLSLESNKTNESKKLSPATCHQSPPSSPIHRFYYCPYHPEGTVEEYRREHSWRKPQPGMLLQAAHDLNLDLTASWMVGDQVRDIEAGHSAGCSTVLITDQHDQIEQAHPSAAVESFSAAVQHILSHAPPRNDQPMGNDVGDPTEPNNPAISVEKLSKSNPSENIENSRGSGEDGGDSVAAFRHVISELTSEIRNQRQRQIEFTALRMSAFMMQMLVILLAVLGLLQLDSLETFAKWMVGAVLAQLVTISLLLMDLKG